MTKAYQSDKEAHFNDLYTRPTENWAQFYRAADLVLTVRFPVHIPANRKHIPVDACTKINDVTMQIQCERAIIMAA